MNISYVVLHYIAVADTIECIDSILASSADSEHNVSVVVVDNGSNDGSLEKLRENYCDVPKVMVIGSKVNLGFANGNNVGFKFAKDKLNADFIVMLNNDTIISQKDFNEVIVRKYDEYNFAVLGPDIVTKDGFHQNPGSKQSWGISELRKDIIKKRVRLLLSYLGLDDVISNFIKNHKEIYKKDTVNYDVTNTILHGACFIFSANYISRFDGLYDKTFLYFEEDILKLMADNYGMLMVYTPELNIYHKEDVSTNSIKISKGKKIRKKYRHYISSAKEYIKLKKEFDNE